MLANWLNSHCTGFDRSGEEGDPVGSGDVVQVLVVKDHLSWLLLLALLMICGSVITLGCWC
jgi:hypothetical protein